ncbi:MAG: hypothetical protein KGK03_06830 [Candidatus Omnitrophica bacterium]|nr:hypothetical protein [Candidatus Omnitrophota bacterium]
MKKFIALIFFTLCTWAPCWAALSLSVSPVDGSNSLRFQSTYAAGENMKEVHIRVTSTNGERYQIFQRVLEPVINEKGEALNLQAIQTQTVPNSNIAGTLYLQNTDHVNMGDQLIYSSNPSGQSDSFVIGYSLDRSLIAGSGTFTGRLVFTVRSLSSGSNDQAVINLFVENPTSFKISVQGRHSPNFVHARSSDTSESTADAVNISFSGNAGQTIRIFQQADGMPQNEAGQDLGAGVLQLDAEGQTDGLRAAGISTLKPGRTLIYSSNRSEDSFTVYFLADAAKAQQQDAGTYRGRVTYVVESGAGQQEFPINVQFDVPPVFTMNVTTPSAGGVNFPRVLAGAPPQDQEVVITVTSNLHKPYQVVQEMEANMTNPQGKEFNNKYFTLQVQIPEGQKGHSDYTEFSPVKTGEYPVFSSDAGGSGATFKVLYRLQGYSQMTPGSFMAPIRFSLDQK